MQYVHDPRRTPGYLRNPWSAFILSGSRGGKRSPRPDTGFRRFYVHLLLAIRDGSMRIQTADGSTTTARSGDVVLIPPFTGERFQLTPGSRCTELHLTFGPLQRHRRLHGAGATMVLDCWPKPEPTLSSLWEISVPDLWPRSLASEIQASIDYAATHWWRDDHSRLQCNNRLQQHFHQLLLHLLEKNEPPAPSHSETDQLIIRLSKIIADNLEDGINATDLARLAGYSRSHLAALCQQTGALSPAKMIKQQRLERAQHALQTTTYPLKRIAADCGFAEVASFSRFFKKNLNCSPAAWRRRQRDISGNTPKGL